MFLAHLISKNMSKKTWDVVGLGACGVDLRVKTLKLPTANHKVTTLNFEISDGGVTANNLVQSSKLGLKVKWIGALGNDSWKNHLIKSFQKNHILTDYIAVKNQPTQQFWVITDPEGEWNMTGILGATRQITADHIKNNFSHVISKAKHFHTEVAVIPLAAALQGAKIARANNVKVFVDIDDDPWYLIEKEKIGTKKQLLDLLKITDIVKLSKTGALGLTKEKTFSSKVVKRILSLGPKLVVITLAEKGCYIGTSGKIIYSKGFKVKTIDTVGAGDAFMGGLSYGILKNWPLEKIGTFANACGAFKCTKFGTRASGNLKQINKFIKSYKQA
jgi:sugar/nucleoside kinase (ribokinase family)